MYSYIVASRRQSIRYRNLIVGFVLLALIGVTGLLYATGGTEGQFHALAHLYYLPIVVAALLFGPVAGVGVGLIAALLGGPFMPENVALQRMQPTSDWLTRGVFFILTGVGIGIMAGRLQQALHDLQHLARRLQNLHEIDRAILEAQTLDEITTAALQRIRAITPCERASVVLLSFKTGEAQVIAVDADNDIGPPVGTVISTDDLSRPFTSEEIQHIEDVSAIDRPTPVQSTLQQQGIRSILSVPLTVEGTTIGELNLSSTDVGAFQTEHRETIQEVAAQLAIAIRQMQLFEAEQDRRQELSALYDLSRQMIAQNDIDEILASVAQHCVSTVHVTFGRVLLLEDGEFTCHAAYPVRELDFSITRDGAEPAAAAAYYQRTLAEKQPLLVQRRDADIRPEEREALLLDTVSYLCLTPLYAGEDDLGVLVLGEARNSSREPCDADKLNLITSIAEQASGAIRRAQLHAELESSYIQTVVALANAMDARDTYTGDHSNRLAEWAEAVAREIGCSDEEINAVRWGALLHDIGKIGVPDSILQKPGKLTESEWTIIKRHPEVGADIIAPVKVLEDVAPIIRGHHERYDGEGYPDGLHGEAIPLGARILAVVDAYSAIVDKRPYDEAQSHEEAAARLRRCAGTQFDPDIVEVFLRLYTGEEES